MPIMTVIATTFDRVAPYMPIPDGVPTNFKLKQHVVLEFRRGSSSTGSGCLVNKHGEVEYHAYYNDFSSDAVVWMHPQLSLFVPKFDDDIGERVCK